MCQLAELFQRKNILKYPFSADKSTMFVYKNKIYEIKDLLNFHAAWLSSNYTLLLYLNFLLTPKNCGWYSTSKQTGIFGTVYNGQVVKLVTYGSHFAAISRYRS